MARRFKPVETGIFLGHQEIPTQIYSWQMPKPDLFGKLNVRFVVPLDGFPRHFYIEPILAGCQNPGSEAVFLTSACASGYELLRRWENHDQTAATAHGMYAALFRNRHDGHLGIAREFASPQDFFDFSSSNGQPSLITPGLDVDFTSPVVRSKRRIKTNSGMHRSVYAKQILSDTLTRVTGGRTHHVRNYYEDLVFSSHQRSPIMLGEKKRILRLDKLAHRSEMDLLFTDGVVRNLTKYDWADTTAAVRQSLIGGPCSNAEFDRVDHGAYRFCIARVLDKYQKLTLSEFDRWLKNVREHCFLQLIHNGPRLQGTERAEAKTLGRTMFCMLLWDAYQHMARCYGALMLFIWLDLAIDEEMKTDLVEELAFRSFHLPQVYLSGLPLAFLTRYQLRWISRPLQQLRSDMRFDAESYDPLTQLLNVFGMLLRDRRIADRRTKASKAKPVDFDGIHEPSTVDEVSSMVLNTREWTGARECPDCQRPMDFSRVLQSSNRRIVFAADCKGCDREFAFRCSPEDLGERPGD